MRIVQLYAATFGTLPTMTNQGEILPVTMAPADVKALPLDQLAGLSVRAIADLAAADSRQNGREPLSARDWRIIRYSLVSARTLRQALDHCADCFEAIDRRCGAMRSYESGGIAEVELAADRKEQSPVACLIDLAGIAQIHALLAWLIGRSIPLARVRLAHPAPIFEQLRLPRLPFELELDAPRTSFSFSSSFLDHPVVSSADDMDAQPASSFLLDLGVSDPGIRRQVTADIRQIILQTLRSTGTMPVFADIVAFLGASPATLRRRLAEEGSNFRAIRESCRRELGLKLLQQTSHSIEQISADLDFCDSDAFRRAFRTWLGVSPSQYRRDFIK